MPSDVRTIDTRNDFEAAVEKYDAFFPPHINRHYLRKRVAYFQHYLDQGRILDVGCGTAVLVNALATNPKLDVIGVDPSAAMLEQSAAGQAQLIRAKAEQLPFPDASFDLTISVVAFHHFLSAEAVTKAINEMARVTRPGGWVHVIEVNTKTPLLRSLMRRVPWDRDVRLVSTAELRSGFASAGLVGLQTDYTGWVVQFTPAWMMKIAALAEAWLEHVPWLRTFSAHVTVRGQKPLASS